MSGSGRRAADYQSSFLFAISVFTLSLHVPDPMTSIEKEVTESKGIYPHAWATLNTLRLTYLSDRRIGFSPEFPHTFSLLPSPAVDMSTVTVVVNSTAPFILSAIILFDNHNDTKRPGTSHGESPEAAKFERELDTIPEESETEEEPPAKPTEISKTVYYNIPAVVINDATI